MITFCGTMYIAKRFLGCYLIQHTVTVIQDCICCGSHRHLCCVAFVVWQTECLRPFMLHMRSA